MGGSKEKFQPDFGCLSWDRTNCWLTGYDMPPLWADTLPVEIVVMEVRYQGYARPKGWEKFKTLKESKQNGKAWVDILLSEKKTWAKCDAATKQQGCAETSTKKFLTATGERACCKMEYG